MKIADVLKMSFSSLANRRLRSWLTILGIVIGVAAVVGLVSIGTGMQKAITEQLSGLGSNLIFVSPGHSKAELSGFEGGHSFSGSEFAQSGTISGNLTENDLRLIKSVPGVYLVSGLLNRPATVRFVSETSSINVQGVEPTIAKAFSTVTLEEGRYILAGDDSSAVIGHNVAKELFNSNVRVGDVLLINNQRIRVVGILRQSGQAAPTDNLILLPLGSARRIFSDFPKDQYSAIVVRSFENANVEEVAAQIEKRLFLSHHVNKDTQDFTILTSQSILETVKTVTRTITFFLGGIAAISLLVGGVGIANTMFMSVMERTKQIGILKAIGATNADVLKLFLAESATMGFVGGIFGVVVGLVFSFALSKMRFGPPGSEGMSTVVTPELITFAIGFSALVGILSGILPARKASHLQPVEALRYE